jgi:hypothetical protein
VHAGNATRASRAKEPGSSMARMVSSPSPRTPGASFGGRYVVQRKLGSGSLGTVYLARDLALDRAVALKVLKTPETDEASRGADARGVSNHSTAPSSQIAEGLRPGHRRWRRAVLHARVHRRCSAPSGAASRPASRGVPAAHPRFARRAGPRPRAGHSSPRYSRRELDRCRRPLARGGPDRLRLDAVRRKDAFGPAGRLVLGTPSRASRRR